MRYASPRVSLRILHISTRLILGGSQENTVLSCEGQARLGHDVHLAYGPIYGPEGSLLDRVQQFRLPGRRGISTHTVPHLIRAINPWADLRCRMELGRLIADLRPDIVHTHSSKAGILGRAAAWAHARRHATGVVHTVHGPPFHRFQRRLANRVYVWSERYAARRCHAIVSVADAMTRQYLAEGIGRPDQYTTVYSGMETERYLNPEPDQSREQMRDSLGLAPADFVIGTVARLAELKGHDDLLDALGPDLKSRADMKLLWVGDGWWRERLLARARGLGLAIWERDKHPARPPAAQLIVTGLVAPEQVPGFIRGADVLAHPSYREGLPRTVPQALLCGVCPVAYDVDGTGEVCRDMETGRLVRPGDRDGLRSAVLWLADHATERAAMAARGRAWCQDRFSARTMVDGLERVYAKALHASAFRQR